MPCKRYPKFDPIKATKALGLDEGDQRFLRGFAVFDDIPKARVERALQKSGMSRYYGSKFKDNAPSIKEILDYPEDDMYLSGEIVPCDVKEEGRMAVNIVCTPWKSSRWEDDSDDSWRQDIQGLYYNCYGWSDIGWHVPNE